MPLNIPTGFASASIHTTGSVGTPNFITTIGVTMSDAFTDLVDLANYVFDSYTSEFDDITSNIFTVTGVSLFTTSAGGNGSIDSTSLPNPGAGTGGTAMIGMAPIMQKKTAQIGRAGRGRMFLPGVLKEADVDESGRISTAKQEQLLERGTDFLANLRGEGAASVYDKDAGPVLLHSSASMAPTPITGISVAPIVGIQRSRIR
uniref:Uncharacterized protein n=1 Tax=uncultured prokaryote TaxID=198431 RepID=A0A0H5QPQ4_9ZZZZ|nr:hypothetical protein [uncultured prokaryote]